MKKEETREESSNVSGVKKYKTILLGLLAVVIVAGIAYSAMNVSRVSDNKDSIAAKVNGENVLQSELQQRFDQETQRAISQGVEVDTNNPVITAQVKSRILEDIINTKLLLQAAKESGVKIDSGAVNSKITLVEQQVGGKEALLAELLKVEMDENEFREEVLNQLTIQQYLLENIDVDLIVVTDEDIALAYEQASAVQENMPPLSEIKEQINSQLVGEKQQELLSTLIESLRAKAEIEIL